MKYIHLLIPEFFLISLKAMLYAIISWKLYSSSIFHVASFSDIIKKRFKFWKNVSIGRGTYINGNIDIGDFTYINSPWTRLNAWINTKISIGKFSSISWWVSIISKNEHNLDLLSSNWRAYPSVKDIWKDVIIGNDVWIGAYAIILPGITIWNGAVIWAGSVVTKNVEPYSIVAWNPAKIIKFRFEKKTQDYLDEIEWWNWDINKIKRNIKITTDNVIH